ncbi:MAG: hypothetical protein HY738_06815 [Bacteroidia bacterium]|nr:hypothetical protein [Bacteroidia bacterium]
MKRKLFIPLFVLIIFSGYSQELLFDWGNFSEIDKDTYFQKYLGSDNDGYYFIKSDKINGCANAKVWLEFFSSTMYARESSNEVLMPSINGVISSYEEMYLLDGKFILFTSVIDEHRKQRIGYVQYINKDGTLKNKPKEIGQLPTQNGDFGYNYKLSQDKANILFWYQPYFTQYADEELTFKVLDPNLTEIFSKKLILPLKDRTFKILQVELGKSGNIYLSVKLEKEGKKGGKGQASAGKQYEFAIVAYNKTRNDFFVQNIELKKDEPANMIFGLNKDENIGIGGFYSNKTAKNNEILGVYYKMFNPSIQKITSGPPEAKNTFKVFEKDFMTQFTLKRMGPPQYFYNYILKDLFFLQNGGFVFIAEHQYISTDEIKDPGSKEITYIKYFHHNDLIAAGVDQEGNLLWYQRIPKSQYGLDDNGYFSSYVAEAIENKIKIIFNDNPSNIKVTDLEKVKEFKNNVKTAPKGVSVVVSVFNDGSTDKLELFNNADLKTIMVPCTFGKAGDRYIIGGLKGKYYKFGSFSFQ